MLSYVNRKHTCSCFKKGLGNYKLFTYLLSINLLSQIVPMKIPSGLITFGILKN